MFKIAEKDHCSSNPGWNPSSDPSSNPGLNPGSKLSYPLLKQAAKKSAHHFMFLSKRFYFHTKPNCQTETSCSFALIVCAQRCCAGNAIVICHASHRLTGPEDRHGVENAEETNFRPAKLLWIIGDPYFLNHESLTLLTIYKI